MMLSTLSPFYCAHCIQCRLPKTHCVCDKIEQIELPFNISLCCHSKEWQRNDNTGQWALLSSKHIQRIRWHRKPELMSPSLSTTLEPEPGHYLLFPSDDAENIQNLFQKATQATDQSATKILSLPIKQLWVIDGTWQEVQKILRQSPWLKALPKVHIQSAEGEVLESYFKLRRNQQGLCTLEAIEVAISYQVPLAAQTLKRNFHLFQNTLLDLLR
ncbi:MAG: DTW domain-containing protein YfiP [Glaciecola sp.]|jgi:DTW domain-containing protein YfiP